MTVDKDNWLSPTWWRQAVVYQIYPRSFADANGDGIGDLQGIISRVDYLKDLGIDAVWLSPFYPSALADGGYDVDDYRDVDPHIGSIDDFDQLVSALHQRGIKLLVDIVPNHSSNRHAWFQEALASPPQSPARDRYIFRRGTGPNHDQAPSDWKAAFGGSAWEPVGDGWFYFHIFAPEQPDWNWANPEVRQDFLTTLRFWSDHGVDGFRVDVAMALAKGFDAEQPEILPSQAEMEAVPIGPDHLLYDRDEVDEIYAGWRRVFDEYQPPRVAVAELWAEPSPRKARYATEESLGQAFFFDIVHAGFNPFKVRQTIDEVLGWSRDSGSSATWVLSNHDIVRHASRFGLPDVDSDSVWAGPDRDRHWLMTGGKEPVEDRCRGLRRARALTMFLMGLPGSLYLYQGEELGLPEVTDLPDAARQDPIFFRDRGFNVGRDGCRVPLPWTATGSSFGFGSGAAHLPQPTWFGQYAVAVESDQDDSTLNLYRQALSLRGRWQGAESLEWIETGDPQLLHFRRPGGWQVAMNFADQARPLPLAGQSISLSSWPGIETAVVEGKDDLAVGHWIPAETTYWWRDSQVS
ncbi:MAG: glycoside hydrolase family 13 protein [Propionibacteriaceae bacterium]|nr:glycoside hydrolase family 13 protein [Propionibacteriaceae bacterium]